MRNMPVVSILLNVILVGPGAGANGVQKQTREG